MESAQLLKSLAMKQTAIPRARRKLMKFRSRGVTRDYYFLCPHLFRKKRCFIWVLPPGLWGNPGFISHIITQKKNHKWAVLFYRPPLSPPPSLLAPYVLFIRHRTPTPRFRCRHCCCCFAWRRQCRPLQCLLPSPKASWTSPSSQREREQSLNK